MDWPATRPGREEVWEHLTSPPFVLANAGTEAKRVRGLTRLLDWLEGQPGETWQGRWLAGGAEAAGAGWRQVPLRWLDDRGWRSQWLPSELSAALKAAICADLIRPSLGWLVSAASIKGALARDLAQTRDPDGFARLKAQCDGHPGISARARLRDPATQFGDHRRQGRHPGRHHRRRRPGTAGHRDQRAGGMAR